MLQKSTFQPIRALWEPKTDLFASSWNRQLDRFVSWKPQLEAMAVDAFSLSWTNLEGRNRGGQPSLNKPGKPHESFVQR
jgi:hypothetical protein